MRVASSQSARSQIPGSRSRKRPCVSAMSSARGVKTSKTNRPCPVARRRDTARRARRRSSSVSMWSSERNGQMTSGNVSVDGRVAHVAVAQVELDARELRALARDLEHPGRQVDADDADPAAAIGTAIRPVPTPSSSTGPPRAHGFLDVERHVLDHAPRPRVVDPGDLVVRGHAAILLPMQRRAKLFSRPRCATGDAA